MGQVGVVGVAAACGDASEGSTWDGLGRVSAEPLKTADHLKGFWRQADLIVETPAELAGAEAHVVGDR